MEESQNHFLDLFLGVVPQCASGSDVSVVETALKVL